jgi:2-iminobutanoate/2-iminopropanoate deaminase
MARQIVFSPKAAKPPATYSQAVKAAGLVFVSGTPPTDPKTGDKIVSVTIVLADEDDFAGMNEEWLRWFPSDPPARQGAKLPARIPGLKVSIAAIAEA